MAAFICLECTVFDRVQMKDGHPAFETSQDFATHNWQSHAGPRPPIISRDMVNTISAAFPLRRKPDAPGTTKAED